MRRLEWAQAADEIERLWGLTAERDAEIERLDDEEK